MSYPFANPLTEAFGSMLGLGLVLGVAGSAKAYTINTTAEGDYIRWAKESVIARPSAQFLNMLAAGTSRESLAIAFEAWRGYEGVPDLIIGEGPAEEPGYHRGRDTNTIHYLPNWPYEDEKLAVTVVTYDLASGRLLDADVLVNGGVNFQMLDEAYPDRNAYDLAAVLSHEAGHMLGLGESPGNVDATMYPYAYPGQTSQRTIAEDDEAAIQMAYNGTVMEFADVGEGCRNASVGGNLPLSGVLGKLTETFWPAIVALGAARMLPFGSSVSGRRRSEHPSLRPAIIQSLRPSALPSLSPSLLVTWRPSMAVAHSVVLPSMRPPRLPSIVPVALSIVPAALPSIIAPASEVILSSLRPARLPSLLPSLVPPLSLT